MVGSLAGRGDLLDALAVALEGEAHVEGVVDEEQMAEDVPGVLGEHRHALDDPDRADLGEGPELRAAAGSALQPDYQGHHVGRVHDVVVGRPVQLVEGATRVLGEVPVDLFMACICEVCKIYGL